MFELIRETHLVDWKVLKEKSLLPVEVGAWQSFADLESIAARLLRTNCGYFEKVNYLSIVDELRKLSSSKSQA